MLIKKEVEKFAITNTTHGKDEDLIEEIEDKLTLAPIEIIENKIKDVIEPINKPFKDIEKDIEHDFDGLAEDIFPEGIQFVEEDHSFWEWLEYFRWISNFVFVGMPWFVWSIILCIFNIFFNILLNSWWADGNWLLVFNSGYLIL